MDPAKVKEFESLQVLPEVKHVVMYPRHCLAPLVTCDFRNLAILGVPWSVLLSGFCGVLSNRSLPLQLRFGVCFSPHHTLLALRSALRPGSTLMYVTFQKLGYELRFLGVWLSDGVSKIEGKKCLAWERSSVSC